MAKLIKGDKQYALVISKKQLELIKILVGHVSGLGQDYPDRFDVTLYEALKEGTDISGWTSCFEKQEGLAGFRMKQEFIDREE